MTGICSKYKLLLSRLRNGRSLLFFVVVLLTACQQPQPTEMAILWHNKRATGLSIPQRFVASVPADSLDRLLTVRLAGKQTAMLGQYRSTADALVFEPLVPFTRGLRYTVWLRGKKLGEMIIPAVETGDKPTLLAIYPTQDSLPDNLLKVYLHFSRSMREGQSLRYVTLLKNNTDTLPGVFLDLQPELWNADRTLLTLWLDPGRIKRDLQPNQRLGAPLQSGERYTLVISGAWPDEQGAVLGQALTKSFLAVRRDSLSPRPAQWTIRPPEPGSRQRLRVDFGEALDYSLLTETLHVLDEAGKPMPGTWQPGEEEKQGWFMPATPWQSGRYLLRIDGRLEDLAGNNLNRPFDRDITRQADAHPNRSFIERPFRVGR